jgi:N-acetylglucosaminyldiphosphoundecaprenol N-acetyl-beta-D-mannosaminyltransferase
MKTKLVQKYPRLKICGFRSGYFDHDKDSDIVIGEINDSRPDILLVAFGAPLQEKFIRKNAQKIEARVLMGVGGLFDFYSGRIARAPYWMRQLGMEWVFRLMKEPRRMWKRYIIGNPVFLYRVFRWNKNRDFGGFGTM